MGLSSGIEPYDHPEGGLDLFGEGQSVRSKHREVPLHGSPGDLDDVFGESNAALILHIFGLVDATEGVFGHELSSNDVKKLATGAIRIDPLVGEDHSRAAAAEERILQEEALLLAMIKIRCDDFCAHDQRRAVRSAGEDVFH